MITAARHRQNIVTSGSISVGLPNTPEELISSRPKFRPKREANLGFAGRSADVDKI